MTARGGLSPTRPASSRTAQCAIVVAILSLGSALKIDGGNYEPRAVALLGIACIAALAATIDLRLGFIERLPVRSLRGIIAIAAAIELSALLSGRLVQPVPDGVVAEPIAPLCMLLALCAAMGAVAIAAGVSSSRPLAWVAAFAMPIALAIHFAAGVAAIRAAPEPVIDVIYFQELAAQELMDGRDPYAMTFPDLSGGTSPFYGPGLQQDGKLLFGYPYPPLSLFLLIPAWLVPLSIQYSHAVAFTAAAALIAYSGRGTLSKAAAVMFMLMPIGPLVITSGWTEPLVAIMLALTVFLAARKNRWVGIGLGLFWAVKQYVPLTSPLSILLLDRPIGRRGFWRLWGAAAATGLLVTLPLVFWDLPAFWHSAVAVQFLQPFRDDALSFLVTIKRATGAEFPSWIAFVMMFAVQALALWRSPRGAAGFAAATATSLLFFFAFNKQAFANYYFLVVAALAAALAASDDITPRRITIEPRRRGRSAS